MKSAQVPKGETDMKKAKFLRKLFFASAIAALFTGLMAGCGNDEKTDGGISIYVGSAVFDDSMDPVKGAMPGRGILLQTML